MQQIKHRLAYQFRKSQDLPTSESGVDNPLKVLLFKITGVGIAKPRRKMASSYFSKHNYDTLIKPAVDAECAMETNKKLCVRIRARHISEMYDALDNADKQQYIEESFEQHNLAVEQWKNARTGPVSQDPADRQRYVCRLLSYSENPKLTDSVTHQGHRGYGEVHARFA